VRFQRVGEHPKRQLELELGGSTGQRQVTTLTAARQGLADQRRLADARLAGEVERTTLTSAQGAEEILDSAELDVTTYELPALRHCSILEPASGAPPPCGELNQGWVVRLGNAANHTARAPRVVSAS